MYMPTPTPIPSHHTSLNLHHNHTHGVCVYLNYHKLLEFEEKKMFEADAKLT